MRRIIVLRDSLLSFSPFNSASASQSTYPQGLPQIVGLANPANRSLSLKLLVMRLHPRSIATLTLPTQQSPPPSTINTITILVKHSRAPRANTQKRANSATLSLTAKFYFLEYLDILPRIPMRTSQSRSVSISVIVLKQERNPFHHHASGHPHWPHGKHRASNRPGFRINRAQPTWSASQSTSL